MQPSIIQRLGYTWLTVPKEDILPLRLLEQSSQNIFQKIFKKRKDANIINDNVFSMFPPKTARKILLSVSPPKKVAMFRGYDIVDAKAMLAGKMKIVDAALTKLTLKIKQQKVSRLLYSFKNVTSVEIHTTILLEEYLNRNPPNNKVPGFIQKLMNEKMYIVTEVLQAEEFTVENAMDFDNNTEVTAETVENFVNTNLNARVKSNQGFLLQHKGKDNPLTFALKAVKIIPGDPKHIPATFSIKTTSLKGVRKKATITNDLKAFDFLVIKG